MLKLFRQKNVTKLVLWGILILILPAFVIWGTGDSFRSKDGGPSYVGLIDNKKISFQDFAKSITAIRCQIILNYFNQPKILDVFLNSKGFLGKMAWDRLLMVKEAEKAKIKVSDQEIVNMIGGHPIFLNNGSFDNKMYTYILKHNMNMDPRTFEEIIRSNIKILKLNNMLTKDITVTDNEITDLYKKDNEKYKLSCIVFSSSDFLDKTDVTEEEIKEYRDMNAGALPSDITSAGGKSTEEENKKKIVALLQENEARDLAIKFAQEQSLKLKELMDKEKMTFEAAASKLGLKIKQTEFFSKGQFLEELGDMSPVAEEASKLKDGEISEPIEILKGAIIFRVMETQGYNKEKFAKDREAYNKKALDIKKNAHLEKWLRGLEESNKVLIDFRDYEKHYK